MFNKIKNVNLVVLNDIELMGPVKATGGVIIGGVVNGDVVSENTDADKQGIRLGYSSGKKNAIHIQKGGVIKGSVRAGRIIIDGRVEGDVECDRLEMGKHGELVGNAKYRLSKIANGAFIRGSMNPSRIAPSEEPTVAELKRQEKDNKANA